MDESWENIHLFSSLHRPNAAVPTNTAASYHLQDFLPIFKKVNPPPHSSAVNYDDVSTTNTTIRSPAPAINATITTLNLGPKSRESRNVKKKSKSKKSSNSNYFQQQQQKKKKVKLVPCVTCSNSNSNNNKRLGEELEIDENSADARFKRMIKNRETAARFRDKKYAYTNELELELTRLKKENALLRKQLFMMHLPADLPTQIPKKPTVYRTLTAPF